MLTPVFILVLGVSVNRSFQEQAELSDSVFDTLTAEQKTAVWDMYKTYDSVMKLWNISNINRELR